MLKGWKLGQDHRNQSNPGFLLEALLLNSALGIWWNQGLQPQPLLVPILIVQVPMKFLAAKSGL